MSFVLWSHCNIKWATNAFISSSSLVLQVHFHVFFVSFFFFSFVSLENLLSGFCIVAQHLCSFFVGCQEFPDLFVKSGFQLLSDEINDNNNMDKNYPAARTKQIPGKKQQKWDCHQICRLLKWLSFELPQINKRN